MLQVGVYVNDASAEQRMKRHGDDYDMVNRAFDEAESKWPSECLSEI